MSQYFPKPYEFCGRNINAKLDLSNCVTTADLKETTCDDTTNLAAKSDLASLKTEVDKMDVDKLKNVPANISKLSNAVDSGVVKKTVFGKLVIKLNYIDTSGFALKQDIKLTN